MQILSKETGLDCASRSVSGVTIRGYDLTELPQIIPEMTGNRLKWLSGSPVPARYPLATRSLPAQKRGIMGTLGTSGYDACRIYRR